MHDLPFALPPSMGADDAQRRAERLQAHLSQALARPVQVRVAASYHALEQDLYSGVAWAAWGPPFVCARVEACGGRALVSGIRGGRATYHSEIVGLAAKKLHLDQRGLRATWVDRDSTAGYLLPQALLRRRGIRAWSGFEEERFAGSYRAAIEEVLNGSADITAIWASTDASALTEVLGARSAEFEVLARSAECPNDGVVLSPRADEEAATALERALLALADDDAGRELLRDVFRADRFEPAARRSYRAVYDLVFEPSPA